MEAGFKYKNIQPYYIKHKSHEKKKENDRQLEKSLDCSTKLILSSVQKKRIENSPENNIRNTVTPRFLDTRLIVRAPHTLYYQQFALFLGERKPLHFL